MEVSHINMRRLAVAIKSWGKDLGFQEIGITDTELTQAENHLNEWLNQGMHGDMHYMKRHGRKRTRAELLVAGTVRIISARMDYFPVESKSITDTLDDPSLAYISRYATGKDYHKLVRKRLQQLATKIESEIGAFGYRAFADSAPVMEKPIAQKAGLGWIGKHSNLLSRKSGSWFFLGELYTDLPLPVDEPETDHCGSCSACIEACPTEAIVAPYVVDARKCISYLTIEHKGSIPVEYRQAIGNRIFGCDDCQMVCPWNRFSSHSEEPAFLVRHGLDSVLLCELFLWTEEEFFDKTQGSTIRRLGYQRWLRNIAIALGNSTPTDQTVRTLGTRVDDPSKLVREHVKWAISQLTN